MDSKTHVELARHLMRAVGQSETFALASLFPQIDRDPPTLHRLHAHTVPKARRLTQLGLPIVLGEGAPLDSYEARRFAAERSRMRTHLGSSPSGPPRDAAGFEAALLGFVSCLWLDTFNRPAQPFAPWSVECAGHFALWSELGDFRRALYGGDAIDQLRQAIFADPLWSELRDFDAAALLEGLVRRLIVLGRGALPAGLLERSRDALEIAPEASAADRATELFSALEALIARCHCSVLSVKKT